MLNHLNIACWNSRGIMPGTVYLSEFFQSYSIDVIGLSEHWLFPHSIDFLHSIDCEYEYLVSVTVIYSHQ